MPGKDYDYGFEVHLVDDSMENNDYIETEVKATIVTAAGVPGPVQKGKIFKVFFDGSVGLASQVETQLKALNIGVKSISSPRWPPNPNE